MRSLVIAITLILLEEGYCQDIVFPKEEDSSHLSGNNPIITERIPVYIPGRCGENMLLYPGPGDRSTWTCDCTPGFLYFPANGTCHKAYRQGPCPTGHYVFLPSDKAIPECVVNPCSFDGHVLWDGTCRKLGESCNDQRVLTVDPKNYRVACAPRRP